MVQEALTNVHKHAADGATDVCLRYLPDGFEVAVRNGPTTTEATRCPVPGSAWSGCGNGWNCSAATLEAAAEPDGGFPVRARVPA